MEFGGDGGVLGRQGGIDRGDQERLPIRHRLQCHAFLRTEPLVTGNVRDPDQEQRALLDVLLICRAQARVTRLFGMAARLPETPFRGKMDAAR